MIPWCPCMQVMQPSEDSATAVTLRDSSTAPALVLQLWDGSQSSTSSSSTMADSGTYQLTLESKLPYKKTDKLPSQLVNTSLSVAICLTDQKEDLAKCRIDLAQLCLGASSLKLDLKLDPCLNSSPYRVSACSSSLHNAPALLKRFNNASFNAINICFQVQEAASATIALTLMHQPSPENVELQPYSLLPPDEGAKYNALEIHAVTAQPIPTGYSNAMSVAGGALTSSLVIHLPTVGGLAVHGGLLKDGVLVWGPSSRVLLPAAAVEELKVRMRL